MRPLIIFSASASFSSGARSALRLTFWSFKAAAMRSPLLPAEAWAATGLEVWLTTTASEAPTMVRSPTAGITRWANRRRRWACAWAWARARVCASVRIRLGVRVTVRSGVLVAVCH